MEPEAPAVSCGNCRRSWNSATMAEGLRLLRGCPRCGGTLIFADSVVPAADLAERADVAVAPHLVLGIPRR